MRNFKEDQVISRKVVLSSVWCDHCSKTVDDGEIYFEISRHHSIWSDYDDNRDCCSNPDCFNALVKELYFDSEFVKNLHLRVTSERFKKPEVVKNENVDGEP